MKEREMSKEHKIVVTRDRDNDAEISIFRKAAKPPILSDDDIWIGSHAAYSRNFVCNMRDKPIKHLFGFLPRKGSKQVLIIKRAK